MNTSFSKIYMKICTGFLLLIFSALSSLAQFNTSLGYMAGDAISSGERNVMVGQYAGELNNGTGNIFIGSHAGQNIAGSNLLIITNDTTRNTIFGDLEKQRIAIGTDEFPTDTSYRLAVEGKIIAREFKATQIMPWPDFVFNETYDLMSLEDLSEYIKTSRHLPGIPTAEEIYKHGILLGELNTQLLLKIEELTLYIIQQDCQLKKLEDEMKRVNSKLENLQFVDNEKEKD